MEFEDSRVECETLDLNQFKQKKKKEVMAVESIELS